MCNPLKRGNEWKVAVLLVAAVAMGVPRTASADQCFNDDVIVNGSLGVGFDAVCNMNFGFDTLVLKENNLRIFFDDTSTSASFPRNDWRILINDTTNGGGSFFAVEDSTASRRPFTIEAGARVNSLFVEDDGDVGLGTSVPVVNLHIVDGNTPTVRLDQDGSSGFTPQIWDLAGNETNFFLRDVTNGSKLPLRIRPNTPGDSINVFSNKIVLNDGSADMDIRMEGDTNPNLFFLDAGTDRIGIGTDLPSSTLHVVSSAANSVTIDRDSSSVGAANSLVFRAKNSSGNFVNYSEVSTTIRASGAGTESSSMSFNTRISGVIAPRIFIRENGDIGLGTSAPLANLDVASGAAFSRVNAGATTFTASSSRELKENIQPVQADDILEKVAKVPVMTYDWKPEVWSGEETERIGKLGLIAEDFHTVLQRGSDKEINGQDVEMTLWLAVQQLHAQNKELQSRLAELEQQVQPDAQP